MEDIPVLLEMEPRFLKKIKTMAQQERRTIPDQTAHYLEKGVCILEIQQNMGKTSVGPSMPGKIP
jgi:hypothetical protein